MKYFTKRSCSLLLALMLCLSTVSGLFQPAQAAGYTANWGTRGETATELSAAAKEFYSGQYTYADFIALEGSTSVGADAVAASPLYIALRDFMVLRHTTLTTYGELRYLYGYTDCEKGNTDTLLSFYSGKEFANQWDQGKTWNREHVWPASKSLSGRLSNSEAGEAADLMTIRPTLKEENEAENLAFGEGSGYQNVEKDLRGDVARTLLYTYVRWENRTFMWGKAGVMQDVNTLLRWLQEDPVDTWELGRNDAVQSITGTRNVFIDYPELAFALFNVQIPSDMTTPSGQAKNPSTNDPGTKPDDKPTDPGTNPNDKPADPPPCQHKNTVVKNQSSASCTSDGYTGDVHCVSCDQLLTKGEPIPGGHALQAVQAKAATCTEDGNLAHYACSTCKKLYADEAAHKEMLQDQVTLPGGHTMTHVAKVEPTAQKEGKLAHYHCSTCNQNFADEEGKDRLLSNHLRIPALSEGAQTPADPEIPAMDVTLVIVLVAIAGIASGVILVVKKKR